ncbi:MAG: hypothetical protein RL885_08450 [Planctomycetota bacterium]
MPSSKHSKLDDVRLESLSERLSKIERTTCPFEGDPRVAASHWVTPKLVAEIAFTEWTESGKLRHPRFLGLRPDKRARDVTREEPSPLPDDIGASG